MWESTKKAFEIETKEEPYINVPTRNMYTGLFAPGKSDKTTMMAYAKKQSVIIGIVNAIINDIFTKVSFRSLKAKRGKGRPTKDAEAEAEQKAMEFYKKNFVKQKLKSAGDDWLITGEGYIWHGSVSKKNIKEIMFKVITKDDLDVDGVHMLKHVPSTTMTPKYDEKNILAYEQIVNNPKAPLRWTPNEIIHAKFMDLDGKPLGFTPMFAARPMIETLGLIIDYAGNYFDGGGAPENAFIFKQEHANSENFRRAKAEVKNRFQKTAHGFKRGQLFFAGDLEIKKVNDWNKDMEFRKLFVMYVGSLAFAFNMPLHRVQAVLGGDMKAGAGASDLSDSGYWRSIYEYQDYWENLLNVGFWNEAFGVDMEFERTYLQDTFRETQATNMSLTNIEMMEKMDLIKEGYKRNVYSTILSTVPNDAINDNPKPQQMTGGQMLPNQQMMRGEATDRLSQEKKKQAGKTESQQKGM